MGILGMHDEEAIGNERIRARVTRADTVRPLTSTSLPPPT